MRLTYETGTATLIQFIVLSFLNIATGVSSTIGECRKSSDCIESIFISIIYYLLIVGWFGFIWILGFAAQDRRSRRLAQALIAAEGLIALIAYFNAKHHPDKLGLVTSVVDLVLAIWIIFLAFRLMRAKGGRVVARPRRRRKPIS